MKSILLHIFLFCTIDTFAQSGITWTSASNVASSSYGNMHPRIMLDADGNPLVLFGSDGKAQFTRWNGSAFTMPMPVNPTNMPAMTASFAGPDIASKGDTVYIVFKDTPEDINHHIFIVRSFDGGVTFSMPYQVESNTDSMSRFPTIAVDETGNPIVAYMKFNSDYSNAHWVVTRSTDYGTTFLPDVPASGYGGELVCDCCPGSIVTNGNNVAVLYRANLGNLRDTWAAFSTDGGSTFPTGINIDQHNWMLMSCPGSGPDGIIIADTLHSIFMNGVSGDNMVYENQTGFTNPVASTAPAITGGFAGLSQQNFPRIANYNSAVGKVWKQGVSGTTELALSFTTNISQGFPTNYEVVPTGNITNADVAVYDGTVHIVWEDANSGTVKYRKGTFIGSLEVQVLQTDTGNCLTECEADVQVTVNGGTPPYNYSWNNGTTTDNLDNVCPGVYAVIVTDATGASNVSYITVVTSPDPDLSIVSTPACGLDGGAADATVSNGEAPFTFTWSNGATTEDLSNLSVGTYVLTITDDDGCTAIDTVTIATSPLFSLFVVLSNPTCGQNDGFIDMDVNSGTPPYTYLWSTGATTEDLTNVPAGLYGFTVTDAIGCTAIYSESLQSDNAPTACFNTTGALCSCAAPFTVQYDDCSVGAGLTYQWVLEGATPSTSIASSVAAVYNVEGTFDAMLIVTNSSGCTDTMLFEDYVEVGQPQLNVVASDDTIDVGESINVQSSTASSYTWNVSPATNATITDDNSQNTSIAFSQPGIYTVCLSAVFNGWCSGCDSLDTCFAVVVVDTVTGIRASKKSESCKLSYSNLSDGTLSFYIPTPGSLVLYDAVGREVRTITCSSAQTSITVDDLPTGVLLYRFTEPAGKVCIGKFAALKH